MNRHEFYKRINDVNNDFLPITKHQNISVDNHFDELFTIFDKYFYGQQPLRAIVPVFYEIADWNKWQLSDIKYGSYFGSASNNDMNKILTITDEVSNVIPGFTITALENLNRRYSGRKIIKISTEKFESCVLKCQLKHTQKGHCEEYHICRNCLNVLKHKYGVKNIRSEKRSYMRALSKGTVSINKADIKNDFNRVVNSAGNNDFALAMAAPVNHHSLFVSDELDLYYFFSNTVIDLTNVEKGKKRDMGLGGMFVLIEKSFLKDEYKSDFISIFERITDKLANRIIHQYRMDEMMRQARKAAISQVFARNGSHNIGSHVLAKMVTKDAVADHFSFKADSPEANNYIPVVDLQR